MPRIEADGYGNATLIAELTGTTLCRRPAAILGRAVIVQAGTDDYNDTVDRNLRCARRVRHHRCERAHRRGAPPCSTHGAKQPSRTV